MASCVKPARVDRPADEARFSIRQARQIVHPYFRHRAWIYWIDMLVCAVIGYGFASLYLASAPFSLRQIASLLVSSFALFRAGSFIHEITHMRQGEMRGFRIGWNMLCGIPMLMPSFFYENHIDHHKSSRYGTQHDGEYLPLGTSAPHHLLLFLAQIPLLPAYIFLRFLLSPITFLHPRLRTFTLERMSSFVMNFHHRRTIPANARRKLWALIEICCCLRAAGMLAVILVLHYYDWTRIVRIYVLAMFVLGLNYNRNLAAHHYRNRGGVMTHEEQLLDSVNITGRGWLTELFFPLGLRYHALHHLFPSLPYHNLARAHRKLMAELPPGSLYAQTVYPSYWSVVRELWNDASRAAQKSRGTFAAS